MEYKDFARDFNIYRLWASRGMSYEWIASRYGISVEEVRKAIARAMGKKDDKTGKESGK